MVSEEHITAFGWATPQEIEPDPSAGRTPGTRPAGEADGNAVGH